MDESNPFEAPKTRAAGRPGAERPGRRPAGRLLVGWGVVFAANLPVPLLFGTSMTDRGGKVGMVGALLVMVVAGGVASVRSRWLGMVLVVGGVAVGLSQVAPVLQVAAGVVGMMAGTVAGVVEQGPSQTGGTAAGPAGGGLVTMVTGSLLIAAAAAIGAVFRVITPGRWWGDGPTPEAPA